MLDEPPGRATPGRLRGIGGVGDQERAARGVRGGRKAGPIHLRSDADAREGHAFRAEDRERSGEFHGIDGREARSIPHVDDPAGRGGLIEQVRGGLDDAAEVGGPERRPRGEGHTRLSNGIRVGWVESVHERCTVDIDGGDRVPVFGPGVIKQASDCVQLGPAIRTRLTGGRIHENHDTDGRVCRVRCAAHANGRHRGQRRIVTGHRRVDERDGRKRFRGVTGDTGGGKGQEHRQKRRSCGDHRGLSGRLANISQRASIF